MTGALGLGILTKVRRTVSIALGLLCGCGEPGALGDSGDTTAATGSSGATGHDGSTSAVTTTSSSPTGSDAGPGTSGEAGTSGAQDSSGGDFVLEVHTELTDQGRLALRCNLPPALPQCQAIAGAPCDDLDDDGVVDAWEDAVIDRLRPLRRFDEAEPLLTDDAATIGDVGRVVAVGDHHRLFVMLGYSEDYGSCSFTAHSGDSERVVLDLAPWPDGGAGGVVMAGAYTAAHENTVSDHGRSFVDAALDQLVFDASGRSAEPRWVVFPSQSKHATYATIAICEGISVVPCIDEDCGPDGVDDAAAFDALPAYVNAGEEAMPLVGDLAAVGFPGDDAWAMQDFCGGQGPGSCSAPVRDKLLDDPFAG